MSFSYIPGQYGIPKPWYFPFTSSYWCGTQAGADPDPLDALEEQNGMHTYIYTVYTLMYNVFESCVEVEVIHGLVSL